MGWFNFFQNDEQERIPLSQRDQFRRGLLRGLAIAFILGFITLAVASIVIATNANGAGL